MKLTNKTKKHFLILINLDFILDQMLCYVMTLIYRNLCACTFLANVEITHKRPK